MSSEVELKAHVDDHVLLKERISRLPGISSAMVIQKKDVYYADPLHKGPWFRVRLEKQCGEDEPEKGILVFTHKIHERSEGTENNQEQEFSVGIDQETQVYAFCAALGLKEYIRKEKSGWSWFLTYGNDFTVPLHLELLEVSSLGWFLEMEFVLPDMVDVDTVEKARELLREMLVSLDIKKTAVESRYYMDMLESTQSNFPVR